MLFLTWMLKYVGKSTFSIWLSLVLSTQFLAHAQLLPKDWQKAVVLIEVQVSVDGQTQYSSKGTGFLVAKTPKGSERRVYLVTAKHIVASLVGKKNLVTFRLDTFDGGFIRVPIRIAATVRGEGTYLFGESRGEGEQKWAMHKSFDVAAIDLSNVDVPKNGDYRVFEYSLLATEELYSSLNLSEGDGTFTIV